MSLVWKRDHLFLFVYYLQSQKTTERKREKRRGRRRQEQWVSLWVWWHSIFTMINLKKVLIHGIKEEICVSVSSPVTPPLFFAPNKVLSFFILSFHGWISSLIDLSSSFIFGLLSMDECWNIASCVFDLLFPLCRCEVAVRLYSAGFTRYTYYLFFFYDVNLWRSRSRFYFWYICWYCLILTVDLHSELCLLYGNDVHVILHMMVALFILFFVTNSFS